jgi:hypothetical protein
MKDKDDGSMRLSQRHMRHCGRTLGHEAHALDTSRRRDSSIITHRRPHIQTYMHDLAVHPSLHGPRYVHQEPHARLHGSFRLNMCRCHNITVSPMLLLLASALLLPGLGAASTFLVGDFDIEWTGQAFVATNDGHGLFSPCAPTATIMPVCSGLVLRQRPVHQLRALKHENQWIQRHVSVCCHAITLIHGSFPKCA